MEPKERAEKIIKDMDIKHRHAWSAKGLMVSMYSSQIYGCALVLCDEMLEEVGKWKNTYMGETQYEYWKLVKQEVIKEKMKNKKNKTIW